MPPPSRTRRILKWMGIVLCLLIAFVWMVSPWFEALVVVLDTSFRLGDCSLLIIRWNVPVQSQAYIRDYPGEMVFGLPHFLDYSPPSWGYRVPLWIPFLLIAIPTAWLFHRDRRRILPGHCLGCGYDLTGNTSGVCSECGAPTPPTHTPPPPPAQPPPASV